MQDMSEPKEIFRKTTAGGKVLVCYERRAATVDGKLVGGGVALYDAPRLVKGKIVVASLGGIGLTAEELEAVKAGGWTVGGEPEPVPEQYKRADSYSREDAAWDRGFERKWTGE